MNNISALIPLTAEDTELLQACRADILPRRKEIMDAFYDKVLAVPEMLEIVESVCERDNIKAEDLVAHINEKQFEQWDLFFEGKNNAKFAANASAIGKAHERCGLTSELYVASGAVLLEKMVGLVLKDNSSIEFKKIQAIIRMFFIELSYSIEEYDNVTSEKAAGKALENMLEDFDNEVGKQFEKIVNSSHTLTESATASLKIADQSSSECGVTLEKMVELTSIVGNMNNIIEGLDSFVNVIEDVSKKTRLLALNATIEAARAGDYGRGFSVVASEIKDLADQAAKATDQIANESTNTSTLINEAIGSISDADQRIKDLSSLSNKLSADIDQQCNATNQISADLQNTKANIEQMKQRILSNT
ncbi:MAG: globin-coupled sensor protein [Hyphomicrobiales bacterium]